MDLKENLLHGSESSIAEPVQTIREGLPRPRSGEFRALFEGNTPWHWGIVCSPVGVHRATIWAEVNAALKANGEGESKTNARTAAAEWRREAVTKIVIHTHATTTTNITKATQQLTHKTETTTRYTLSTYTRTHTHAYIIISKMKKPLRKWINLR